jgi:DMSO/TMAO reductase YedYZ molybdopterin-dependent catalytic subunit/nitrite reductase/ring-hydroxylating ferredoxin subunit
LIGKRGYSDQPDRIPPGWRIAPSDRWPINNPQPSLPEDFQIGKWRFRTLGEVDTQLELSYEEFQGLPHVTKILDHHCVDGWSFLGQSWDGVELSAIKKLTGAKKSAKYVMIEGAKSLSQRFPIDQDLLLADGQNGSKLSKAAGFPLRLVAPGEFGYKSRKWIDTVRFCAAEEIDGLELSFQDIGAYELYTEKVGPLNPWTVLDQDRKLFLRQVFSADTEDSRRNKKSDHLEKREGMFPDHDADEIILGEIAALEKSGPHGLRVLVNGAEILLLKSPTEIFAIEPICTHIGTDLTHGKINQDARTIKCPLHGAVFDLASGNCLSGSYGSDGDAFPGIRTYEIVVRSEQILLLRKQAWGHLW